MPAPLNQLPWDVAKDQFGPQGTDFIGVMGALMVRAAKDQFRVALQTLRHGRELLEDRRLSPTGLIKVVCPITMARDVLAPLLKEFLGRYPDLRIEIEPYATGWDQEPREDAGVFFKLLAPKDSLRRVRPYPGTVRGLFASPGYIQLSGSPATPDDLTAHHCLGSGAWKLSWGKKTVTPNICAQWISMMISGRQRESELSVLMMWPVQRQWTH
jgi:DNA-binding transcriptional LysR family regulator